MNSQNNIYDPVDVDQDYFLDHDEEREEFYTKALTLPGTILEILFNEENTARLKSLFESYQLKPKQSEELSRLIRKILVAEIYLGDIVAEITKRLEIDQEKAKGVANSLIGELFTPALEDIKKLHVEKFGKKQETPPQPTNPNNVLDLRNNQK